MVVNLPLSAPLSSSQGKEATNEHEHVLITEFLTDTIKESQGKIIEEHNIIAVSPNDHRWYR